MGGLLKRLLPAVAGDSREAEGTGSNPQRVVVLPRFFPFLKGVCRERRGDGGGKQRLRESKRATGGATCSAENLFYFPRRNKTKRANGNRLGQKWAERRDKPRLTKPLIYRHVIKTKFHQKKRHVTIKKTGCIKYAACFVSINLFIIFYKEFQIF